LIWRLTFSSSFILDFVLSQQMTRNGFRILHLNNYEVEKGKRLIFAPENQSESDLALVLAGGQFHCRFLHCSTSVRLGLFEPHLAWPAFSARTAASSIQRNSPIRQYSKNLAIH